MADEDFLPLLGFQNNDGNGDSSDDEAEDEYDVHTDSGDEGAGGDAEMENRPNEGSEITFDPSLPVAHSYLGNDLEDIQGRTIHNEDSVLSIPIISLPGVVLVPGQTVPLHIFSQPTVSMIRTILQRDKTFGIVTARQFVRNVNSVIGTTAEIFSAKEESDDVLSSMKMKAIGRQRFQVIDTRRQIDGILVANVKILRDTILPDFLEGARPPSHNRICHIQPIRKPITSIAADRTGKMFTFEPKLKKKTISRLDAANLTQWPTWVYKQYDSQYLVSQIKSELQSWNETLKGENMPSDATDLSYWVAANLPLDDTTKIYLLQTNSVIHRLRCELKIMQRSTATLQCSECDNHICNKSDVFTMSVQGPMGTFVNPGGYVHEMFTIKKVEGISLIGRPETQHSWFPGYAWTIAQCRHCSSHMGWRFTVANKKTNLKPEKFWGLCRASLKPGIVHLDDEDEDNLDWLSNDGV